MEDTYARELIRRRLLSGVCNHCIPRNASVSGAWKGLLVVCRDRSSPFFSLNFWGLAILKKLNKETRVYRTFVYVYIKCHKTAIYSSANVNHFGG